ncbi:Mitochodrial transcription termination factor-related [Macleaya cordata]|uniref:Mitochodrial transcription termination factor-related n=1 Tax=Macleaya cordata TaxID=56857 RepID=A0A200Q872_MACCD|nr:Mitochodrial transcription termination factor-related [Macleaya cordata]
MLHSLSKNILLHQRNNFRNLICFQTLVPFSTSVTKDQPPHNSIIVNLLINSFGFTEGEAISVSKRLRFTVPPTNINRVPDLLKQSGFSDTHIKDLISRRPTFLSLKNETLKSKLDLLQELGFSGSALVDLIFKNPKIVESGINSCLVPNVKFLLSFLHSNENIVKALKRSSWLLSVNFSKTVGYNVEILRECSVGDKQISQLLLNSPRFFTQDPDRLKDHVSRAEKFGFKKGSASFIHAVCTLNNLSKDTLEAKFDMYKSYGWSESDIVSAFRKSPSFLHSSEQKIKATMDFFVGELGYDLKDIALKPNLFIFSLDKKLKPRYEVLKMLKSRGLESKCDFLSVAILSEKRFLKRCVLRYVEKAPELQEAYMGSSIRS